ncbi:uncharacterized protein LOC121373702 isoform X2 [Gigantopelta aegis]|uniref:uncharacterized protein LOC121373702 isoform X2 n=1 Tax=Gigantopelta aegis TaxID=1735272 RepID=UPI001B88A0F3|nr:uncharacterized protein LOC121373702 isoform X2 [Gigantopelta aegis]
MEIMDKNENVTNGQLSETTLEKLGTTWADLSPTHGRTRNIMNDCLTSHVLNDNHIGQKTANDNAKTSSTSLSSEVVDNRVTLENGPVIKLSITAGQKPHDRHATTLPKRSTRKIKHYATWKDLSPTKDKCGGFDSKMSCSCGSTPRDGQARELVTWKDVSPPISPTLGVKDGTSENKLSEGSCVVKRSPERRGRQRRKPESGYYSNDVQGESREGTDSSLSGSDIANAKSGMASSPEDACNEYFYDEDFIVQFDTNIRDGSVPPELSDHELNSLPFPHSLTGSYTRFGPLQDSFNQANVFLGQYESELSGSRTSMEISSSEREMMCSSDMLDFSNDPLFTPTPTSDGLTQHFSVDSLGHGGGLENSRGSADLGVVVNCCPKKEEYFLSFDTSQGRSSASVSEHSYSSQTTSSQEEPQTEIILTGSGSTTEDNEEVCSSSFHFCHTKYASQNGVTRHCRLAGQRSHIPHRGRASSMGALPERSLEKSSTTLSDVEKGQRCFSRNSRSLDRSGMSSQSRSSSSYKRSCGSAADLHYSDEVNATQKHNLTSWKRVKNLQKFGILENMLNNELYNSLPDVVDEDAHNKRVRKRFNEDLQSMADSFHNKRHSASLLEMYQRMKSNSNPVSPNTMNTVECILFPQNRMSDDEKLCVSRSGLDTCCDSEDCCCGKRGLKLELGLKQEANGHRVGATSSSWLRTLSPSRKAWSSKSTSVSPDTLVLWHGTKNFAAQFPPKTKDCGIQTSEVDDDEMTTVLLDHSVQTSPNSPQHDFLSVFNDVCGHQSRTPHKTEPVNRRRECVSEYRERNVLPAASNVKRSKSLSPSRMGFNSFYTYQSLPDLSFLSSTRFEEDFSPQSSLFDPVKIPIILTPVVDDSKQTQSRDGSCASCSCQKEKKCRASLNRPHELVSSSSGFSTSSSSGIDPGYCDTRRCCTSLAADLERLLFLPPHLESNPKFSGAQHKCGIPSSRSEGFRPKPIRIHQRAAPSFAVMRNEHDCCRCENCCSRHESDEAGSCHSESGRREYEISRHECEISRRECEISRRSSHEAEMCRREMQSGRRLSNSTSSSLSSFHLDGLYALKEASPTTETADSGPDHRLVRQHSETYLDELKHNFHDLETDPDAAADSLIHQIYQQLSRDRKPLKSCLRKKRDFKARSLSIPDNFNVSGEPKPPKKPSRYSIACDGVFPQLVSDEHFENANIQLPPPEQREEQIFPINEAVMVASSSSSSFEEGNFAKKSVSFASEVSFHSPQYSPKHVTKPPRLISQTVSSIDLQDETLTLEIIEPQDDDPAELNTLMNVSPQSSAEFMGNLIEQDLTTETARKRSILLCVTQAAESLVEHFARARDPFDKLRLGSSAENPTVATLVVTRLCPALEMVIEEGMKAYLMGFHVFGKIHITPWRVAEMSSELGPYTRAVNELVRKLKLRSSLGTNKQKFFAFIVGLANLRLLDFWMGYVRSKKDIVSRVYEADSILCLSETTLKHHYDNMLLALQPLAVLPFQLEFEIVCPSSALESSAEPNQLSQSLELKRPIKQQHEDHSRGEVMEKGQGQTSEKGHCRMLKRDQGQMSQKNHGHVSERKQGQISERGNGLEKGQGQEAEKGQGQSWSWFGGATFPRTKRLLSSFNAAKAEDKLNNSVKNVESSRLKLNGIEKVFSPKLTKDLENIEVKEKLSKAGEKPIDGGRSPVSSFTNLAQKFLQRTQSQDGVARNTLAAASPMATRPGRRQSMDSLPSTGIQSSHGQQSQSFSLISFFDKLLLPEKPAKNQRSSWIADAQIADENLFQDEARSASLPAELDESSSSTESLRGLEIQEDKDIACEKLEGATALKVKDVQDGCRNKENEAVYPEFFLEPRLECERTMLDFETSDSPSEGSSIQLEVDVSDRLGVCIMKRTDGKLSGSETKDTFLDESSQEDEAGGGEGLASSPPISEGLTNSSPISEGFTNSSPISESLADGPQMSDGLASSQPIDESLTSSHPVVDGSTSNSPIRDDATSCPPISDGLTGTNLDVDSLTGVDINANSPSFQNDTYAIVLPSPMRKGIQTEPRMEFRTFHPQLSSFKPSPSHSSQSDKLLPSESQSDETSQNAMVQSSQSEKSIDGDEKQVVEATDIRKDSFGMTSFKCLSRRRVTITMHGMQ